MNLLTRLCRRPLSRPTWKAGARHRDDARKSVGKPRRWGHAEERFAFHYQYQHIKGERLLRCTLPRWLYRSPV